MTLALFSYWRATAPYRVRIGLALKGLKADYRAVDLAGGAQTGAAYAAVNPQRLTPALLADGEILTQSLSILEWLDEVHPAPPLLPSDPLGRARVRAMAEIIACDVHPLNNLRVLKALRALGVGAEAEADWIARWMKEAFEALEPMIRVHGRGFAYGASPTIADCCLVPQAYSARRFGVDLSAYPSLLGAVERTEALPVVAAAHPDRQPDAPRG